MESKSTVLPIQSANPTVDQARNRSWIWLLAGALGITAGGIIWSRLQQNPPPAVAAQATAVDTETIQSTSVREFSEFVGVLEAQERVTLRPEVEGRVTEILVDEGDRIPAGTPIVQLSSDRPQAVVSGAVADIEVARAARNAAGAEILEAEANLESAAAERNLQEVEYDRTESLVAAGALPQQSLDRVERDLDAAIATQTAAERRIQTVRANLAEATASLQRAESNAAVASEDLSDYQVVAPMEGVVGNLPVKIGDYVRAGELLTTLTSNQTLDLHLSIPVERSGALVTGLPVELRTQIGTDPLVTGSISFVAERVENDAQAILAKASFPNPGGALRDEQFVRAHVIWSQAPGVLVPTTAISRIGGQSFVFVMAPSEDTESGFVAVQRPVELGLIENNRYHVVRGLEAGETLITAGILRLSDGAPVTPEDDQSDQE